jgi:hypothetical protein
MLPSRPTAPAWQLAPLPLPHHGCLWPKCSQKFGEDFGIETIEAVSQVVLSVIQIAKGQMSAG